jgi:ribonuclease-3
MTTNYLETGVIINKSDGTEEVYQIPYNLNNVFIKEKDVIEILERYNVKVQKLNNFELFHQAFTHKSYIKKDIFTDEILHCVKNELNNPQNLMELQPKSYERLEYFGDRVVKITVSFYLFNRYLNEDEGFMTRLQTKLEDKKNLAMLSKELRLERFFILSKQIENVGGRTLEKIHEDVFEAFMGALFFSVGFEPCVLLLLNLLETTIDYSDKLYKDNNYKDILLRFHHKNKWKFPQYHLIETNGPAHKRIYIIGVENPNLSYNNKKLYKNNYEKLCISFGKGMSKKDAEQQAAKMSLIINNVLNKDQYHINDIYYWKSDIIHESNLIISDDINIISNKNNINETDSEYED